MNDLKTALSVDISLLAGAIDADSLSKDVIKELNKVQEAVSQAVIEANPDFKIKYRTGKGRAKSADIKELLDRLYGDFKEAKGQVGQKYKEFFRDSLTTIEALSEGFSAESRKAFMQAYRGMPITELSKEIKDDVGRLAATVQQANNNIASIIREASSHWVRASDEEDRGRSVYLSQLEKSRRQVNKRLNLIYRQTDEYANAREERARARHRELIATYEKDNKSLPSSGYNGLIRAYTQEIKRAKALHESTQTAETDNELTRLENNLKAIKEARSKSYGNSLAMSYAQASKGANDLSNSYNANVAAFAKAQDAAEKRIRLSLAGRDISSALSKARLAQSKAETVDEKAQAESNVRRIAQMQDEFNGLREQYILTNKLTDQSKKLLEAEQRYQRAKQLLISLSSDPTSRRFNRLTRIARETTGVITRLSRKEGRSDPEFYKYDLKDLLSNITGEQAKQAAESRKRADVEQAKQSLTRERKGIFNLFKELKATDRASADFAVLQRKASETINRYRSIEQKLVADGALAGAGQDYRDNLARLVKAADRRKQIAGLEEKEAKQVIELDRQQRSYERTRAKFERRLSLLQKLSKDSPEYPVKLNYLKTLARRYDNLGEKLGKGDTERQALLVALNRYAQSEKTTGQQAGLQALNEARTRVLSALRPLKGLSTSSKGFEALRRQADSAVSDFKALEAGLIRAGALAPSNIDYAANLKAFDLAAKRRSGTASATKSLASSESRFRRVKRDFIRTLSELPLLPDGSPAAVAAERAIKDNIAEYERLAKALGFKSGLLRSRYVRYQAGTAVDNVRPNRTDYQGQINYDTARRELLASVGGLRAKVGALEYDPRSSKASPGLQAFLSQQGSSTAAVAALMKLKEQLRDVKRSAATFKLDDVEREFRELEIQVGKSITQLNQFTRPLTDAQIAARDAKVARDAAKRDQANRDKLLYKVGKNAYQAAGGSISQLDPVDHKAVGVYLNERLRSIDEVQTRITKKKGISESDRVRLMREAEADSDKLKRDLIELNAAIKGNVGLWRQASMASKAFFRYAILYGGAYSVINYFRNLTRTIIDYQDALKGIQVIAKASAEDMGSIGSAIRDVSRTTGAALSEVAAAAETLAQAGVDAKSLPAALKAVSDFALATGSQLQVAADVITSAKEIFGDETTFSGSADQLTKAVNISKLRSEDLRTLFNLGAQTAQASNMTQAQFLGTSATLSNLGIKSSTVATGVRQLLLELFNPDDKTLDFLRSRYNALGENRTDGEIRALFQSFQKAANPLIAALTELRRLGAGGVAQDEFRRVLDIRAENVALPLIRRLDELAANTAQINAMGVASSGAEDRVDTLRKSIDALTVKAQLAAETFGGPLLNGLKTFTDSLGSFLDDVVKGGERLRRAGKSSEVDAGTAVSGGTIGYLLAKAGGRGWVGQLLSTVLGATAAEGAVATGQAVDNARGDNKGTITKAVDWLVNGLALLSIFSTLGKDKVVDGKTVSTANALAKSVKVWGTNLVEGLSKLKNIFSAGGAVGGLVTLLSRSWPALLAGLAAKVYKDIYDFGNEFPMFGKAAPQRDTEAFDTLIAEQNRKVEALAEQRKAFDPSLRSSIPSEAKAIQDSLDKFQGILGEMFGARVDEAKKLFEELGSVAIEGGTDQAKAIKAKLEELRGQAFSEQDFSKLVSAQSEYVAGEKALYGKAEAISQQAAELMGKSKDSLTRTEAKFLQTYYSLQGSPLFKPGTIRPDELGLAVRDLFTLIKAQTEALEGEYRQEVAKQSALTFTKQYSQFDDAYFQAASNKERERLRIRVQQAKRNPTPENQQFLDNYLSFLNGKRQQPGIPDDLRKVVEGDYQEIEKAKAEAADKAGKAETQKAAQDKADADSKKQRDEQVAKAQDELRLEEERTIRLQHQRNENLAATNDLEKKIRLAKEQHEWGALLGPGGLLAQKYDSERKALQAEKDLAAARLRAEAAKQGINLPPGVGNLTDDQAVRLNRSGGEIKSAYDQYENAKLKLINAANDYRNERDAVRQDSNQKIAFTETPAYRERQRRIDAIETEIGDEHRDSADALKEKYRELYELQAQNVDEEIAHLKSQKGTYKADQGPKFQADLEDLEARKRKLKVDLDKRLGTALREINTRQAERDIQRIQQQIKRNDERISTLSNSQGSVRNLTRAITGQPPASGARVRGGISSNAQQWYDLLVNDLDLNLTPEDAAAIVGNLMVEGSPKVSPTIVNPKSGAYGSAQWLGPRKDSLMRRDGYDTLPTQFKFLKDELLGKEVSNESKALRALKAAPTLEGKALAWMKVFERPSAEEQLDSGPVRAANARRVLGIPASPESAEISQLVQANAELNRQLAEAERRKAGAQPGGLTPEAEAAIREEERTREYDTRIKGIQALLDGQRSQNETQQYLVEMAQTLGLPQGPSYTSAREAAGMAPAPADAYGRLERVAAAFDKAKIVADNVLEEALAFRDAAAAQVQNLQDQKDSANERGLSQQEKEDLDAQLKLATDSLKQWDGGVRELAQRANQNAIGLAQTRQEMQTYRPTLFGETYTTKEIGPDGKATEKLVQVYGQLDQIDFASIAGDLNKLNYSFNRLGENIRNFVVNVIDTFVSQLAQSVVDGFQDVDTTSLQATRAELDQLQADAAYEKAVRADELKNINRSLRDNPDGPDSGTLRQRKQALEAAAAEADAAAQERIRAVQERARAEQEAAQSQGGMGEAFGNLAKEGLTTLLKTAILAPFEKLFGGRPTGAAGSPLHVVVDKTAGEAAGGLLEDIGGSISEGLGKAAGWAESAIGFIGSFFAKGGMVKGPGTGTSDSIPAWLSNGEYVLTADEVRAIGVHNIERWKNAVKTPAKFASGGLVSTFDSHNASLANSSTGARAGDGTVVNVIDQRSTATSQPVEAVRSQGPDGKEMIQIMVRDAVKHAINSGALDRTMAINYGARRPGARR